MTLAGEKEQVDIWFWTRPFQPYVWLALLLTVPSMFLVSSLMDETSPFGFRKTKHYDPLNHERRERMNCPNALFLALKTMVGKAIYEFPRSPAARTAMIGSFFLMMFMIAAFEANLNAQEVAELSTRTLTTVQDLQVSLPRCHRAFESHVL
jgi:hypothetical protein